MKISAKTIKLNSKSKIRFHPLAKKLYEILMNAYIASNKEEYLKDINNYFGNRNNIPLHIISMIPRETNSYEIIGGCFSPIFDIKDIVNENSIISSYVSSTSLDRKNKTDEQFKRISKKRDKEFKQDIIDFIYMDFIRTVSILSLSKPGAMYKELGLLTKQASFETDIWNDVFESNSILLKDFALLIDRPRDTLIKQSRFKS
ncbi:MULTISPECIES: hypothetical protein [unclassified Psychrobacter]|uniref:hypothetical protein n=1 Tax=unclassified Psychrobacter TaxID=196806 RepID=UPI0007145BF1|nr:MULTISPECIES: hypothetical protein [unclassified Psychrobacter]KRG34091.1 hypothetical protein AK822_03975 [Psychrobacter sp. P11F6]MBE8610648.1 hypothetical protein [Pseudomonas lundensis]